MFHSLKVWAGNEDCEDVTWQECKLVNQTVDFTLPKVECEDSDNPIPYMRFVDTNKTQMITKMVCEESERHSISTYTYTFLPQFIDFPSQFYES